MVYPSWASDRGRVTVPAVLDAIAEAEGADVPTAPALLQVSWRWAWRSPRRSSRSGPASSRQPVRRLDGRLRLGSGGGSQSMCHGGSTVGPVDPATR